MDAFFPDLLYAYMPGDRGRQPEKERFDVNRTVSQFNQVSNITMIWTKIDPSIHVCIIIKIEVINVYNCCHCRFLLKSTFFFFFLLFKTFGPFSHNCLNCCQDVFYAPTINDQ